MDKKEISIFILIVIIIILWFTRFASNHIIKNTTLNIPFTPTASVGLIKPTSKSLNLNRKKKSWVGDLICGCGNNGIVFNKPSKNITTFIETIRNPLYRPPIVTQTRLPIEPPRKSTLTSGFGR